jgi:hypothetical protein
MMAITPKHVGVFLNVNINIKKNYFVQQLVKKEL